MWSNNSEIPQGIEPGTLEFNSRDASQYAIEKPKLESPNLTPPPTIIPNQLDLQQSMSTKCGVCNNVNTFCIRLFGKLFWKNRKDCINIVF